MVAWGLSVIVLGLLGNRGWQKRLLTLAFFCFEDGVLWVSYILVNLYICLTISSCHGSIPLTLGLTGRDGGLSTPCHIYGFSCQQRVLKLFAGSGYICSNDWVAWLWHLLVSLYIWFSILSCYDSIPLTFGLIRKESFLSTLYHSYKFACQQRVLKTFPDPGSLPCEDGVVWLWNSLINLYIWLTISCCYPSILFNLGLMGRDGGLSTFCDTCGFGCQ